MEPTAELKWGNRGLIPAIVQDAQTKHVLMLAWMNEEALDTTRVTGYAHFYSRSRKRLWKKGETSGNTLQVEELRLDCDADTILILANPAGPACHTGAPNCFFRDVHGNPIAPEVSSAAIVDQLFDTLQKRKHSTGEASYTKSLLDGGAPKILAKIAEEHGELAQELPAGPEKAVIHETADLLFHILVGWVARDIPLNALWKELTRRFGTSGHVEKASR